MKKFLLILFVLTILSSCTSDNDFRKGKSQLEQQGYTDVKIRGGTPSVVLKRKISPPDSVARIETETLLKVVSAAAY